MDEGVDTFSNPNHVPPFLDEILSNLMGNLTLTDVCGSNAECLIDFAQTGEIEVGMAAIAMENETATELQETCKLNHVHVCIFVSCFQIYSQFSSKHNCTRNIHGYRWGGICLYIYSQ